MRGLGWIEQNKELSVIDSNQHEKRIVSAALNGRGADPNNGR